MDTTAPLDLSLERRLDAIVDRFDQLAEDLRANSEHTEVIGQVHRRDSRNLEDGC